MVKRKRGRPTLSAEKRRQLTGFRLPPELIQRLAEAAKRYKVTKTYLVELGIWMCLHFPDGRI